jgi:hypothetical protein
VAQLGARFHGMEEVIGSIPIRSTNKFLQIKHMPGGGPPSSRRLCVILCHRRQRTFYGFAPTLNHSAGSHRLFPGWGRQSTQFTVDRVDRRLHACGNLLHRDVRRRCSSRVPHNTLYILYRALLLSQRRDGSANDLEGELQQVEITSELVKYSLAIVVGVEKSSNLVGEDEVILGKERRFPLVLCRCFPSLFFALKTPCLQVVS